MKNSILPKSITTLLDLAAENIARTSDIELWDDMTNYLVTQLRLRASKKYGMEIVGCKYIADVKDHLTAQESDSRYLVVKRS